jgi:hypothetical protein
VSFLNDMRAGEVNKLWQAATPNQGRWDLVSLPVLLPRTCAHCCNRGLDFTPTASDRVLPDETPIIVVLHGLSGGPSLYLTVVCLLCLMCLQDHRNLTSALSLLLRCCRLNKGASDTEVWLSTPVDVRSRSSHAKSMPLIGVIRRRSSTHQSPALFILPYRRSPTGFALHLASLSSGPTTRSRILPRC